MEPPGHCECAMERCPIRELVFRVVGGWRCPPGDNHRIARVSLRVPDINEVLHIATISPAGKPKADYPASVDVLFDKRTPPEHREIHLLAGITRLFRTLQILGGQCPPY